MDALTPPALALWPRFGTEQEVILFTCYSSHPIPQAFSIAYPAGLIITLLLLFPGDSVWSAFLAGRKSCVWPQRLRDSNLRAQGHTVNGPLSPRGKSKL